MATSKAPRTGTDRSRVLLLAAVGRDHFLDGKSKVRIAEERGLSRFQVAALLQEAQDRGIVRISISIPDDRADAALAAALGIAEVVTSATGTATRSRDDLTRTVAEVIVRTAAPGSTIGIAWSRTLQRVIRELPPMPTCSFVQLAGALSAAEDTAGPRLLAAIEGRTAWPLWAPLVVDDASALRSSPEIRRTLQRADDLDLAVIAIGRWGEGTSSVWDRVSPSIRRAATAAGAVAEISGRLLDAEGREVASPLDGMVVAATLAQIAAARHTIAVASGADRADAVLAATRRGAVDTLVCDPALHTALAELLDGTGTPD